MEIEKILLEKGIKTHLKGFYILIRAIDLVMYDRKYIDNVSLLYRQLATEFKKSQRGIEMAIKRAVLSSGLREPNSQFISRTALEILMNEGE